MSNCLKQSNKMNNQRTREYKQGQEGRWLYKETETSRNSGRTYTNYYQALSLSRDRNECSYSQCTEEEYNRG